MKVRTYHLLKHFIIIYYCVLLKCNTPLKLLLLNHNYFVSLHCLILSYHIHSYTTHTLFIFQHTIHKQIQYTQTIKQILTNKQFCIITCMSYLCATLPISSIVYLIINHVNYYCYLFNDKRALNHLFIKYLNSIA